MAYDGRKWPNGQCELYFDNATWPSEWHQTTRDAMTEWNNSGASFRFVEDSTSLNSLSALDRGYNGRTLAQTWVYPQQPKTSLQEVQVEVNLYFSFTPPHPRHPGTSRYGTWDLKSVLVHELGHTLHLHHSTDQQAIMYHDLPPGQAKGLRGDDINEIKGLYP